MAVPEFTRDDWRDPTRRRALIEALYPVIRQAALSTCWLRQQGACSDDQSSTVVVALLEGKQEFENLPALFGYIRKAVLSNLVREGERRQRRREIELVRIARGEVERPDQTLEKSEEFELVAAALENLDDRHRLVLQLREVDELSFAEIGEQLGVAKATAYRLLIAARAALRQRVSADAGDSGQSLLDQRAEQ